MEVEGVTPDAVAGLSLAEIGRLTVYHGNESCELGEHFELRGDPADQCVQWTGDLSGVHWIGAKMASGRMDVQGDAGRHIGSEMRGGEITVSGNAGGWVGAEMRGGRICVDGNAGHLVGAAYRGTARGMRGGEIYIRGDAGNEIGHTLRRGLIVIGGRAGDLIGFNMLAGTIALLGEVGIRHGAGMRRGTLVFAGDRPGLLPTFRSACRYQPPFLPLLWKKLDAAGLPVDAAMAQADWQLHHGDMVEGGRGEVLIRADV